MSGLNESYQDGQSQKNNLDNNSSQQQQSRAIEITTDHQGAVNEPSEATPITSTGPPEGYNYGILKLNMKFDPLMIVFTIMVFAGGIIGYWTKGSTISLVSGTIFAVLLAVSTFIEGTRKNPYPLLLILLSLAGMMTWRYYQTSGFMPSGLIALLAFLLAARHFYLLYLRRPTV